MKRIIILINLVFAIAKAQAQPTLDECRKLAREHYPEIRQYDLVEQTKRYNLSNATRAWLPQFALNTQATWQTDVMSLPDAFTNMLTQQGISMPGLNKDQYKIALDASQTIWDGGKTKADKRIAEASAKEQRLSLNVDMFALDERIDNLYFGILLLDEQIKQIDLTLKLLQSNLEKVRSLFNNGAAMRTDADAVEIEILSLGQQRKQVEATSEVYRKMLEIFIGKPISGKLQRPEITEPYSRELARPELKLFDARNETLSAQISLVKSSVRPRIALFAQGFYGYPGLNYFENMMSSDWSWGAIVGIKMSWNFGALYTQKNNLQKLQTAQQQIEVQRDAFKFNTNLQIAQESGDIARLRKVIADDDKIVSLRQSVREAAESKLRNGIIDANDLLRKITDEAAARSARSAREIELLKTIYELKHTINQ